MSTPDYFARIPDSIDWPLLREKTVVVVGIGTVGSQMATELARCGVGHFILIDGDRYEEVNRSRHVLPKHYVDMSKAEAMTLYLDVEVPEVRLGAVPRYVNRSMSDDELDSFLDEADLIIAATDDRHAQRRIGQRALALTIPAVFPALYGDEGGEVVVQLDPRYPCFMCWDAFRPNDAELRGVAALNAATWPVIHLALALSLGLLDPRSEHRNLMRHETRGGPPNQIFQRRGFAALARAPLVRRPDCPSCAVGPAIRRRPAVEWRTRARIRRQVNSMASVSSSQPPPHASFSTGYSSPSSITVAWPEMEAAWRQEEQLGNARRYASTDDGQINVLLTASALIRGIGTAISTLILSWIALCATAFGAGLLIAAGLGLLILLPAFLLSHS
jgi:molybdopterin/thiamine biosynthesis adenylyltransferase